MGGDDMELLLPVRRFMPLTFFPPAFEDVLWFLPYVSSCNVRFGDMFFSRMRRRSALPDRREGWAVGVGLWRGCVWWVLPLCLTAGRAGRLGRGFVSGVRRIRIYMLYIANTYFIIHCLKCFRDFVFIFSRKLFFPLFKIALLFFIKSVWLIFSIAGF
jgi:hypothetical protein